jgi:hypothetical protein
MGARDETFLFEVTVFLILLCGERTVVSFESVTKEQKTVTAQNIAHMYDNHNDA